MEREPAWSPDGQSIAYFSDESGLYALHVAPQTGGAVAGAPAVKKFPLGKGAGVLLRSEVVAGLEEDRVSR